MLLSKLWGGQERSSWAGLRCRGASVLWCSCCKAFVQARARARELQLRQDPVCRGGGRRGGAITCGRC